MKFLRFGQLNLGSSLSLPTYGREGQGQRFYILAVFFAKQKRPEAEQARYRVKNSAAESEGKQYFLSPPTPFLFARPSVQFWFCRASLGNQSGFCSK